MLEIMAQLVMVKLMIEQQFKRPLMLLPLELVVVLSNSLKARTL